MWNWNVEWKSWKVEGLEGAGSLAYSVLFCTSPYFTIDPLLPKTAQKRSLPFPL